MNQDTPIIFADGTDFYRELGNRYKVHTKGLFILAPSASGKTYYIENQKEKDWIDGDYLWSVTNADPTTDSWVYDAEVVSEVNRRSDVITHQAKKLGFWVMGSSNDSLRPDAIVLLPVEKQMEYVQKRSESENHNGANKEDLDALFEHRKVIELWKAQGVPSFESIELAVEHLVRSL